MGTVLVAYATRMGATGEIAETIATVLRNAGHQVTVHDADQHIDLDGYDAVVLGSALYLARWRPAAITLLDRLSDRADHIPVWLFQSGPCDEDADLAGVATPRGVLRRAAQVGAAPATTFGGRIESATARGWLARKMAEGPRAGDFRDFDTIRRWAQGIATELSTARPNAANR